MFYSFRRLMDDWNIGFAAGSKIEDVPSLGSVVFIRKKARLRLIVMLAATFVTIGVCAVLVSNASADNSFIRIGYLGFGFVLGYWFR